MHFDPIQHLNAEQTEAVVATEGPVLVLAGAGTGKTRVLTHRIAYLVKECGIPPWQILAFTFTNKAAGEMRERVMRLLGQEQLSIWVGTFHATGVRILRREGEQLGISRNFAIYDADDSLALIKTAIERSRVVSERNSPRAILDRISRWKSSMVLPERSMKEATDAREEDAARVYAEYEKGLTRAHALDFDDLIAKVVLLFSWNPTMKETYSSRFRYVLVDEFQDTNTLQMELIEQLASYHRNLFVVGDDDQSIYSWRGATIDNILGFESIYQEAKIIRLERNYRSTGTILKAANAVIAQNAGRMGKDLWTEEEDGEPIHVLTAMDEDEEGYGVVQIILEEIEKGMARSDVTLLYRTNAQSRPLEDALRRNNIPYQIVGGTRFYERKEVRDVLAYLKVLFNRADDVNLRRILNVPRRGIGDRTLEKIEAVAQSSGSSVFGVLESNGYADLVHAGTSKKLAAFRELIFDLSSLTQDFEAPRVIRAVVDRIRYQEHLKATEPDTWEARWENVQELEAGAEAFARASDDPSLGAFLQEIALLSDVDRFEHESEKVTLMTLHNAKGLEFPCVLITGMEEGLLPHSSSFDDQKELEEERRLFYVGLTRARTRVYLTSAMARYRFGNFEHSMTSRFLAEIPEHYLEIHGVSDASARAAFRGGVAGGFGVSRRGRSPGERVSGEEGMTGGLFGTASPSYEDESQEAVYFEVGMRVRHPRFGEGTIQQIEGSADMTKLTIVFPGMQAKKILARYANLEPLL